METVALRSEEVPYLVLYVQYSVFSASWLVGPRTCTWAAKRPRGKDGVSSPCGGGPWRDRERPVGDPRLSNTARPGAARFKLAPTVMDRPGPGSGLALGLSYSRTP